MSSTAGKPRIELRFGTAIFGFILLLALYVLSIGPAWWLFANERISEPTITHVYRPIWWLEEQNETVEWVVHWYLMLWYDDAFPPQPAGVP